MDIKGAVVSITGAARGIGRAVAEAFAERGAKVGISDVLGDDLARTAAEMKEAGRTVFPVLADVTDVSQVEEMVAKVEAKLGPIDVQINNAATFSVIGPVWEVDHEKWFRDIKVNLYGTFLCCRAVARRMVERGGGYIMNVLSSGGVGDPHPYSTSYASSKAGAMRLTEGLAREVEKHGVKVFAVAPPAVLTEMTKFIMDDPGGRKWRPTFRGIFDKGRGRPPEVVANLALWLVSGKADRLTGRYFLTDVDLDELASRTDEILEKDLMTLRIKKE